MTLLTERACNREKVKFLSKADEVNLGKMIEPYSEMVRAVMSGIPNAHGLMISKEEVAEAKILTAVRAADKAYPVPELYLLTYLMSDIISRGRLAINKLTEVNYPYAIHVAKEYEGLCSAGLNYDDLRSAGYFGLRRAAIRFDFRRARFITFADFWVRNEIKREIENHANSIRLPVHIQNDPAKKMEVLRFRVRSLDAPIIFRNGEEGFLGDIIPSSALSPEDQYIGAELGNQLVELGVGKKKILMLFLRYGFGFPVKEIGRRLGISPRYISRMTSEVLDELRNTAGLANLIP